MYDILTTDEFSFKATVDEFMQVMLHMDVYVWNHNVAKVIKIAFKEAKEALHLEGFSMLYAVTPNPKFAKAMGGGEDRGIVDVGDTECRLIVWDIGGLDGA